MSEAQAYQALAAEVRRTRLQGEDGFEPIRKPADQGDTSPAEVAPTTLTRDEVRPGMRQIDGRWFYSAAWL